MAILFAIALCAVVIFLMIGFRWGKGVAEGRRAVRGLFDRSPEG
jgi:hypothetical protein